MNSLYGRFGLSPILERNTFIEEDNSSLINKIDFKNGSSLFSYLDHKNTNMNNESNLLDVSTPISMITTAYARIFMSEFKIKYAEHLLYSDTDSLVLSCPLPDYLVGVGRLSI
jgi:hypothetical protein